MPIEASHLQAMYKNRAHASTQIKIASQTAPVKGKVKMLEIKARGGSLKTNWIAVLTAGAM